MSKVRTDRSKATKSALAAAALALLAFGTVEAYGQAMRPNDQEEVVTLDPSSLRLWLAARFSKAELQALEPGAVSMESHYCGCSDTPVKHFPYAMVLLKTPKGDLVARPDRRGISVVFTTLAVRHGDRYCKVEAEDDCYGAFAEPCAFTDFRYGPHLAEFFPTCKSDDEEPDEAGLQRTSVETD